jgi:DnaK suppressor protein
MGSSDSDPRWAGLRQRLLADRARTVGQIAVLAGQVDEIVAAAADVATDDEHDPEGQTIAFERAQATALLEQSRARLTEIDLAIVRLDAGTYGTCVTCGQPIGVERLDARPAADTCITCASRSR